MKNEYRTVRYFHGFFSHYCYKLEVKRYWKFLWMSGIEWDEVAGNSLTQEIPYEWQQFNIVDHIISDEII